MKKLLFLIALIFVSSENFAETTTTQNSTTPQAWGSIEYLHWWVQNSPINVPLITQNNNPSAFGFIGEPGTTVIFGTGSNNPAFNFGGIPGVRINIGGWVNKAFIYGLEASGYTLFSSKKSFTASSIDGKNAIINIPFFSVDSGNENVLVNRLPNTASVSDTLQSFGFELNGLYNLKNQTNFPLIFLLGFRYLNVQEKLRLNDAVINALPIPNSVLNVRDDFSTGNDFYGIQTGIRTNIRYQKIYLDFSVKIAFGNNHQILGINGQTNINNQTILQPIGLFAEPTNIGNYQSNQFAVLPELQAKIGYHFTQHVHAFIGYDFFYLNKVIRPGEQIDRNINLSQNSLTGGTGILSGPAAPSVGFNNTSMWMQGIGVGIEYR